TRGSAAGAPGARARARGLARVLPGAAGLPSDLGDPPRGRDDTYSRLRLRARAADSSADTPRRPARAGRGGAGRCGGRPRTPRLAGRRAGTGGGRLRRAVNLLPEESRGGGAPPVVPPATVAVGGTSLFLIVAVVVGVLYFHEHGRVSHRQDALAA